jgi:hypothetical protein
VVNRGVVVVTFGSGEGEAATQAVEAFEKLARA